MATTARALPLGGVDVFLTAMDAGMRSASARGNLASLVVELDGEPDLDALTEACRRVLDVCPWLAARLWRPRPWGRLQWRASAPPTEIVVEPIELAAKPGALESAIATELSRPMDPRTEAPLRLRVVRQGPGSSNPVLLVTWFHALMDPTGAEHLLQVLDLATREPESLGRLAATLNPNTVASAHQPLGQTLRQARAGKRYLERLRALRASSPGGLAERTGGLRVLHRCASLTGGPLADATPREQRQMPHRLAAVAAAVAPLLERRGLTARPLVVPLAVDIRRKGALGPLIGNHIQIFVTAFDHGPVAAMAAAVREQLAAATRSGDLAAGAVAMQMIRWFPLRWLQRKMAARGAAEMATFHFADTGPFANPQGNLCGATVRNAYHVPGIADRPGLGVFANRCGTTGNVTLVFVEGAIEPDEAEHALDAIAVALGLERQNQLGGSRVES